MKGAVFLDRDGVVNVKAPEGDYIKTPAELELLPRAPEAIKMLNDAGISVFVVTNQRGVARRLMTASSLEEINTRLRQALGDAGARIDGLRACVHDHVDGCDCRKPRPGMLLELASEHAVELADSWMIGDRASDIEAGRRAGCRTILAGPLIDDEAYVDESRPDFVARDLEAAVVILLEAMKRDGTFASD